LISNFPKTCFLIVQLFLERINRITSPKVIGDQSEMGEWDMQAIGASMSHKGEFKTYNSRGNVIVWLEVTAKALPISGI
jgi:hypothetical protein